MAILEKEENQQTTEKEMNPSNSTAASHEIEFETQEKSNDGFLQAWVSNFFENIYILIFNSMRNIGLSTIRNMRKYAKHLKVFYQKYLSKYVHKIDLWLVKGLKVIFRIIRFCGYKIHLFLHFFVDAKNVIKKGYCHREKANFLVRLGGAIVAFGRGVRNNKQIFVTWFNYALPTAAIIGFCFLVNYVTSLNFAVSVEYNGENVGYIQNEAVFEQAEAKLQQRMTYVVDDEVIDNIPKFAVAVVPETELKTDLQLTDAIIQSSSQDIVKASGLSVDGVFYGAVKDGDVIQARLDTKLEEFKTANPTEAVRFTKNVSVETGFFVAKNIKTTDEIIALIDKEEEKDVFYTVEAGDTPIMIAAKNDIQLDELVAYNPDILTNCQIGKQVLVNKSQPFLPVSVIREETYEVDIPFQTEYTDSAKLYKGMTNITRKGVNGKRSVTASVEYVDGIEVSRTELSSNIIQEAVTQKITRGTGVFYADTTPYSGNVSASGFIWPVSGSYISSAYGYRGRSFHTGIDCAFRGNGYGKPIYAAAGGKVVYAGWGNSYGNLVKIDHGGGVQTWYAHSSKILVKVGQIVQQGEQIARVGSTGRSTGNHLHFEVRVNGVTKNPRNYLP